MERVRPIQQDRAVRTADALARAAWELMQEKPLDDIPVSAIVQRAGLSVGAFYARFGCKEALLDYLCQDRLTQDGEEVLRRLRELEGSAAGLEELVRAYVDMAADFFERNAVLLREVVRLAYGAADEETLRQTLQVNQEIDRRCVEILLTRRDESRHPQPERVLTMVPVFVAAMLRSFVLLRTVPKQDARRTELRREIAEWILSALQLPSP